MCRNYLVNDEDIYFLKSFRALLSYFPKFKTELSRYGCKEYRFSEVNRIIPNLSRNSFSVWIQAWI